RAPKIERDGTVSEPASQPKPRRARRRTAAPRLGRLRAGEIPGVRGDALARPWATIVLTTLSLFGLLFLQVVDRVDVAVVGPVHGEWWRVAVSPFVYGDVWYQLAAVLAIAVYGWLVERRHGALVAVLLFALGGAGGAALAVVVE